MLRPHNFPQNGIWVSLFHNGHYVIACKWSVTDYNPCWLASADPPTRPCSRLLPHLSHPTVVFTVLLALAISTVYWDMKNRFPPKNTVSAIFVSLPFCKCVICWLDTNGDPLDSMQYLLSYIRRLPLWPPPSGIHSP